MNQTKLESFVETCLNTAAGFVISFCAWPVVAAVFGYPYSVASNLAITLIFTVLSVARGYAIRRWFNAGLHKAAKNISRNIINWRKKNDQL